MQMVNPVQHKELGDCSSTITLATKELRKVSYLRFVVQLLKNSDGDQFTSDELKRHPIHLLR